MAWTQSQIDAMKAAIANGKLSVRHGESMIVYRSVAEMKDALAMMEAEVNPPTTKKIRYIMQRGKGL
jgi:hypothetical protein